MTKQSSIIKKHPPIWMPKTSQKVHDNAYGLNPLVDHAATFFQLLHNLAQQPEECPQGLFEQARKVLVDIQAAYSKLHYPKDILLAAHFALCATLDDIIFSYLPYTEIKFSLLNTFHQEQDYEKKFFNLLNYTLTKPEKYIDLTELLYLCMLFGFKGHYKNSDFGLMQYQQLSETVYSTIVQSRGEHSYLLSSNPSAIHKLEHLTTGQNKITWANYLLASTATLVIIFMLCTIFHFIFDNATSPEKIATQATEIEG